MSAERPPARPWFDLVSEKIAVKGWGVAELARRAQVGRPTIYGWRDNANKPQPGPVNAVADVLGIPRLRALQLAGIVPADTDSLLSPGMNAVVGEIPDSEDRERLKVFIWVMRNDPELFAELVRLARSGQSPEQREESGEHPYREGRAG